MHTVLVIEDIAALREHLRRILQQEFDQPIDIVEASDGTTGIKLAASLKPDLIIMDIGLPDLDGIGATKLIMEAQPNMRVVMLTSNSDQQRIMGALSAGAVGYILKDADPQQMIMRLRSAVEPSVAAPTP